MQRLSQPTLRLYERAVDAASSEARVQAEDLARAFGRSMQEAQKAGNTRLVSELREYLAEELEIIADKYASVTESAAARVYEEAAASLSEQYPDAQAANSIEPGKFESQVRSRAKFLFDDDLAGFQQRLAEYVEMQVWDAAKLTIGRSVETHREAIPEKDLRFARKIRPGDTCETCFMLASRGFIYKSRAAALAHQHTNCKCTAVPGTNGDRIFGYDLAGIQRRYRAVVDELPAAHSSHDVLAALRKKDPHWLRTGRQPK